MKLIHEETSLVVAGAWSPAIVTPAWVLQYGLEKQLDGTNRYQAFLPAGLGLVFDAPRYVLEDLTFSVRHDALIVNPKSEEIESLNAAEDVVARLLDQLKHTPVGGVGHNFGFIEQKPQPEQLAIFTRSRQDVADVMPNGFEPATATLIASFTNAAGNAVVNVQRTFEGEAIITKVNFHHTVANAEQALSVLRGQNGYLRMSANYQLAYDLVTKIYGDIANE